MKMDDIARAAIATTNSRTNTSAIPRRGLEPAEAARTRVRLMRYFIADPMG
jgi:hypothetical protein